MTEHKKTHPGICFEEDFERLAWDGWQEWRHQRQFLAEIIRFAEGNTILELGCGRGEFGYCADRLGFRYLGLDLSDYALDICREKGLKVLKHNLALGYLLYDMRPDIIVAHQILEHLAIDSVRMILRDAYGKIKNHGVFSVQVPIDTDDPTHLTMISVSKWKKLFWDAGFEIVHDYSWAKFGVVGHYALRLTGLECLVSGLNVILRKKSSGEATKI